jgi:AraC-like DNA-binding protein
MDNVNNLLKISEPYHIDLQLVHSIGTDKDVMNYYHFHNVYEIYLALTPGAEMWINNQRFIVSSNDLFLLSTRDQHRVIVHDRTDYERYYLYFNPLYIQPLCTHNTNLLECFDKLGSSHTRTHCLKLSTEETQKLLSYFTNPLFDADISNSYACDIKRKILLAEILIFINEVFVREKHSTVDDHVDSNHHHILMQAMEYISIHYQQDLNAQQVSELYGLNRHQLNKLFKEVTGLSFQKYLINTRIIKARDLLEQGCTSTTDACYESGFNDYAHFIRTFSNAVGISPGKYARQFQKNNHFL